MFKLEQLALAMATVEGWRPQGKTATAGGSRSYRNHNPGNLRSSPFEVGKDGGFSVFKTDWDGLTAMIWDIRQKAQGNTSTGLGPEKTLLDLIKVWAPASDNNDPAGYLMQVCKMTGFSATMKLKELLP